MLQNRLCRLFVLTSAIFMLYAFTGRQTGGELRMPYKQAGLTVQEAAAHLLNRFSFGIQPGEVDAVVKMGLDKWLQQQLDISLPDTVLQQRLSSLESLSLSNETIVNTYLTPAQLIRVAVRKKLVPQDSINVADREKYRAQIKLVQDQEGYKPIQELHRQLINQKVLRAVYGKNQLQELLTDFWFNHFNVSLTKAQCSQYVLTYERDAIRPYVLGNFEQLLLATAKHPAMLAYLDNALSVSNNNAFMRRQEQNALAKAAKKQLGARLADSLPVKQIVPRGLNENYAREVMELHTLGVDGGYTQQDVTELSRALTGWGIRPLYKEGAASRILDGLTTAQIARRGFVVERDFFFRRDRHDEDAKTILGKTFPAGGGYEEGEQVLRMLAQHPATAKFIATKLAARFVSDVPSPALVRELANVYSATQGNIKAMIVAMVNHPAFWLKEALREKIKSPFEFVISAIRATKAEVLQPYQVFNWCSRMGQRFYYYQAPTGFPDRGNFWINTGALLNRMNFGLALAGQKIPGIRSNLLALNQNHEPESVDEALHTYSKLLLPERNLKENIQRLEAMIKEEGMEQKISDAAARNKVPGVVMDTPSQITVKQGTNKKNMGLTANSAVKQVVGIIIGSPEFQRK